MAWKFDEGELFCGNKPVLTDVNIDMQFTQQMPSIIKNSDEKGNINFTVNLNTSFLPFRVYHLVTSEVDFIQWDYDTAGKNGAFWIPFEKLGYNPNNFKSIDDLPKAIIVAVNSYDNSFMQQAVPVCQYHWDDTKDAWKDKDHQHHNCVCFYISSGSDWVPRSGTEQQSNVQFRLSILAFENSFF